MKHSADLAAALVPQVPGLQLDQLHTTPTSLTIFCTSTTPTAQCPRCAQTARRVRGSYVRRLADLPWGSLTVAFHLRVRKFACDVRHCAQRIFTERLPALTEPYARRTARLTEVLRHIAFATVGEGGSRLAQRLRTPTSAVTLLRLIRRTALPDGPPPRVIGIDDWARRKGQTYGTIVVDLEQQQVVDLLPDRTAPTVATWLQRQPQVAIISRDRGSAYAEGAASGAPHAIQVADRWHLLGNLGDTLERVLHTHATAIKRTLEPVADLAVSAHQRAPSPSALRRQPHSQEKRTARRATYTTVQDLRARGMTLRAIAERVGLSRKTVQRWVHTASFPERHPRPPRPSRLDPYKPYLIARWNDGCHTAKRLWQELQARGYRGGCTSVRDFLARFRPEDGRRRARGARHAVAVVSSALPPTPRQLVSAVLRRGETVTPQEQAAVRQVRTVHPEVDQAVQFTYEFAVMVRQRQPEQFEPWLWRVANSEVTAFRSFAAGIQRDKAAVVAGLTLDWSQGQVEGQINRLKLLKRSMYGRANLDLLRQRMRYAA
jgi:transposase